MKKFTGLFLVGGVLIAGGVIGWLTQPTSSLLSASSAVERGLRYLETVYTSYHYPDAYLEYVYPGEALTCPLEGCTITYRILDAFFDVRFLEEELVNAETIRMQIRDAEKTLAAILPEWRTVNLYNTIVGNGKGGFALDTTCIIGYVEDDETTADHVADFLTNDGNWLKQDEYPVDRWRNIADETWCIRLFARTGRQSDRLKPLTQEKIRETDTFLAGNERVEDRIAVLFHMLYLLADQSSEEYAEALDQYAKALAAFAVDPSIAGNTFTQANILDALARVRYGDQTVLDTLAREILSRQRNDGSWTQAVGSAEYPVFTTFRATIALNKYERLRRGVPVERPE